MFEVVENFQPELMGVCFYLSFLCAMVALKMYDSLYNNN